MGKAMYIYSCSECPNMNYISASGTIEKRQEVCSIENNKYIADPVVLPPSWCPLPDETDNMPKGTVLSLSEDRVISLYDKDGKIAGRILFGEKNIIFSGEIDKSANTLFSLLKYVVDGFMKER